MRKHDVRKWLHAVLDVLPILVIPTFMIFSHRHDVTTDTVIVEQQPVYYQSNEVTLNTDLQVGNIYYWKDNLTNTGYTGGNNEAFSLDVDFLYNQLGTYFPSNISRAALQLRSDGRIGIYFVKTDNTQGLVFLGNQTFNFIPTQISDLNLITYVVPFIEESQYLYVKEYLDITTTIPNNVGTTLMNNFIDTSNEFFNFDNVFTFGDIHTWINTNIFGGNPPAVVGAIWNIIVYEFLMDMLFLFYALFMFLIDFIESLMERAFCKSNHGGVR